ncbi:MAG: hypothetical protein WGN25_03700 [Candidatus Electrothrix sp. GW3-4]|uniref:hypothetical protein n=1 Tax=Candidatus Electrothrix sp. GW3-4 TaxID=3126740 RepID=UPI0030D44AB3
MSELNIPRTDLNNKEFLELRQATDKIAGLLSQRLKGQLATLRPLFIPRKLLGTYIKSSSQQEINGSDKAFAELQERYSALCEAPFQLPKKLHPPLPAIANALECVPLQYELAIEGERAVTVTSPTRFLLAYQCECPLERLRGMVLGREARQEEEMRQALISHLALVLLLEHFPALKTLLEDLRYQVDTYLLPDLGKLPAVMITVPLTTFLPPDSFITEVTQLSGIPAFQEIIAADAVSNIPDLLQQELEELVG